MWAVVFASLGCFIEKSAMSRDVVTARARRCYQPDSFVSAFFTGMAHF